MIASIETGQRKAPRVFFVNADRELGAGGVLVKAFNEVDALARGSNQQLARLREPEDPRRVDGHGPGTGLDASAGSASGMQECGCGLTVARWGGREAWALRVAMRLPIRAFAEFLGVAVATVSAWESKRSPTKMHLSTQDVLDQALKLAGTDARARFRQLLSEPNDGTPAAGKASPCCTCAYSILREAAADDR